MTDKVCLTTGGGRGIGAAAAHDDLDVGRFADLAALERIGKDRGTGRPPHSC